MQTILSATIVSKWNLWARRPVLRTIQRERASLKNSGTLKIGASDFTIRCLKGRLWITLGKEAGDIILSAGEVISRPERSVIVIEALGDSEFEIVKR